MLKTQDNTLNFFGELQNNPFNSEKGKLENFKLKLGFLVDTLVGKTNFDIETYPLSSAHTKFFGKIKDLNLNFNYALAGIHLISSRIDTGRISQIRSADDYSDHSKLLQLYYDIYGRANTLNERFIEVFKRKLRDIQTTTFKFNFTDSEICYKDLINSNPIIEIDIPNYLGPILFPDELSSYFYKCPKNISWFSYARSRGIIESLNDCIEKGYYTIIKKYEFKKIKELLKFIDLQKADSEWDSINDFNSFTNNTLIELLKIFQGAFIYKNFARESICTTLIKDNENILGITVGCNSASPNDLHELIRNNKDEVLKIVDKGLYNNAQEHKEWEINNLEFADISIVKDLFVISEDTKNILGLTNKISKELRELQNEIHEGRPLRFIIYVADQSIFSKFKLDYSFSKTELSALNIEKGYSNLKPILMAHYSIFQSGFTGLFIDFNNPHQEINIVRPSQVFANNVAKQTFFEVLENTANTKPSDVFMSATKLFKYKLAIIDFGEFGKGRVSIYMNGLNILNFPDKYENKWWSPSDNTNFWNQKENIEWLLNYLFRASFIAKIVNIQSIVRNLADSILNISETPGKGSMLVFVKHCGHGPKKMLDGYRNTMNAKKLGIWKDKSIFDFTSDELTQLLIPDGACVVNLENLKIENQLQIIPIKKGKAIDIGEKIKDGTKGTRHNTAMAITEAIEGTYSICISADGPISVFNKGKPINNKDDLNDSN